MGIFDRIKGVSPTLPSDRALKEQVAARGGPLADRATQIYRKNPKLVGGIALAAGALLLTSLRKRSLHK